jgi:hypothetical protein
MADAVPVVHIAENSPEKIAYKLLEDICRIEKYSIGEPGPGLRAKGGKPATREWLLDTYAECIEAVLGSRHSGSGRLTAVRHRRDGSS